MSWGSTGNATMSCGVMVVLMIAVEEEVAVAEAGVVEEEVVAGREENWMI